MGVGIVSFIVLVSDCVDWLVVIEVFGGLCGFEEEMVYCLCEYVNVMCVLVCKQLCVFFDLVVLICVWMMINQFSEFCVWLLVECGVELVEGGYCWCSDLCLMLFIVICFSEGQIDNLLQVIGCLMQVIYVMLVQLYYFELMCSDCLQYLCDGWLVVFFGNYYFYMEDLECIVEVILCFFSNDNVD